VLHRLLALYQQGPGQANESLANAIIRVTDTGGQVADSEVFKIVNAVKSMRVSKEVEQEGLDVPEFGLQGYPEDVVHATEF
jgi:ammonia channel protein AmtB